MRRARIDRRPMVRCASCFKFVGIHGETRFCECCGRPLKHRSLDASGWWEENAQAYREKRFIWACILILELFVAALGYTFKKLQNYNVVDIAYVVTLVLILIVTQWYIRKYVHPKYPKVFNNALFRPGVPELPPEPNLDPREK